ncbi:MAG: class I SAM-dependent methyltransferase [Deltaproteobacteria bacterium]|nr:class I SAM-dependent methyltransferase [Deltaproteobacteria bacterium]
MEVTPFTKLSRFVAYLRERVRTQGVSHLPAFLFRRARVELTERRYGIHTRGWIGARTLTDDPNCLDYDPIDYETIQIAFQSLDLENRKQVLIDYGCGKGRVLAVAARFPFHRIIGLELSKYLCEIAESNVRAMRLPKLCNSISIVNADARAYEVPSDVTVAFLFNPFAGEVLARVASNIEESFHKSPREITIFHIHFKKTPSCFAELKDFKKTKELPLIFREGMVFEVFESKALH